MFRTPMGRFRFISITEGVSFLLLLGIAMPLKYGADMPEAVMVTGWAHGVLFILYALALAQVSRARRWGVVKSGLGFVASLVPFGPFVFDAYACREPAEG